MASATFTHERHLYTHNGVVVPSVTQVLSMTGIDDVSGIPIYHLERAAGIGTAVHLACELLDKDDLALESLDESIQGYVLAYQRFRANSGFESLGIEYRRIVEEEGYRYGMCVDRYGVLDGQPTVLDLKTASKKQSAWQIQTAAYALGLADQVEYPGCQRIALHLAKEGTYKVIKHEDDQDFEVWWAALRLAHFRLKQGAKLPQ